MAEFAFHSLRHRYASRLSKQNKLILPSKTVFDVKPNFNRTQSQSNFYINSALFPSFWMVPPFLGSAILKPWPATQNTKALSKAT